MIIFARMGKRVSVILAAVCVLCACSSGDRYVQTEGFAQGGKYVVKFRLPGGAASPEEIRDSIENLLFHIDTTLSGYNPSSQLSRFNNGQAIRPDSLLLATYALSYRLWEQSGGLLDFAAGPLFDAWGWGFRDGDMPSAEKIDSILPLCGMKLLPRELPLRNGILNPADIGNPRLNFNAVAQGLSCDIIASYLESLGIEDYLVNIGEIRCSGLNPSGKPWAVGIDRPVDRAPGDETTELDGVWLSDSTDQGIVTSGNYRKFYIRDGKKYAHTINPLTGRPVDHSLLSATVVYRENAAMADAFATWCMVAGFEDARNLIEETDGCEGYLICAQEDGTLMEWASEGFTLRQ